MNLLGRTRELGLLRTWFDAREPSLIRVSGPSGVGKTAVVRRAADDLVHVHHRCPPLPDPSQREALADTLAATLASAGLGPDGHDGQDPRDQPPSWDELLRTMDSLAHRVGTPTVYILDDAHRLTEARSRLGAAMARMGRAEEHQTPWHIVAVGRPGALPALEEDSASPSPELHLTPLGFRGALPLLPGGDARERLEAYGVFGGSPAVLRLVDPQATLVTNIRRLFLAEDASLGAEGVTLLERELQTPSRYAAILATLAEGESTWGAVHQGVTDLTSSGQVAPYLRRLEEMGLVEVRRSLDARPKSRNRRYRLVDPFLAFWYRLAAATGWRLGEGPDLPARVLRDAIEAQAEAVFPAVCRQYMEHDAVELLVHNARECGSLWGAHPDIDVAGILRSGAAFYGVASWSRQAAPGDLRTLDRAIRETRYGFGREARLRLLFSGESPSPEAQRAAARRHDTVLISTADLAGGEPERTS